MPMKSFALPARVLTLSLLCAALYCTNPASAGEPHKTTEKPAAPVEFSDEDHKAIQQLLERMGAAFVAGDANALLMLFDVSADRREKLRDVFSREFAQMDYEAFTIQQIAPDETLQANRHTVDVQFSVTLVPLQTSGPQKREKITNSTSHTFVVQKRGDGTFALLNSTFFDSLGLRRGMSLMMDALLAVMALCAFLAFWVWMGYEAYRARPRRIFWRTFVLLPILGPLVYFGAYYLPRKIRGDMQAD